MKVDVGVAVGVGVYVGVAVCVGVNVGVAVGVGVDNRIATDSGTLQLKTNTAAVLMKNKLRVSQLSLDARLCVLIRSPCELHETVACARRVSIKQIVC